MKKLMHLMFLSCRKATELIEKRLLIGLSLSEKMQLMMHKGMCDACSKYSQQSPELDKYLQNNIQNFSPSQKESNITVSDEYKESIIEKLEEV